VKIIAAVAALSVLALAGGAVASPPEKAHPAAKPPASAPFVMASPLAGSFDWAAPFAMLERLSAHVQHSGAGLIDGALPARVMLAPKELAKFAQAAGMHSYAYVMSLTGKPAEAKTAKAKTAV